MWEDHHRQGGRTSVQSHRWQDHVRRQGRPFSPRAGSEGIPQESTDDLPEPVRVAQSQNDRGRRDSGRHGHSQDRRAAGEGRQSQRTPQPCGPCRRALREVPPRVQRRAAAAHRHRAGPRR